MNQALVIGNGESRRSINIESYSNLTKIGCNAIHRDHTVDHLICCDYRMVEEAVGNPLTKNSIIYTRERGYQDFKKIYKHKNVKLLPQLPYTGTLKADEPINWGSGPYAVLLASQLGFDKIVMIGFDLYGIQDRVNNIYKNSKNYSASQTPAVDPNFWIYQIMQVFKHYPKIQFEIYNDIHWKLPTKWILPNVNFFHTNSLTINTVLV